MGKYVTEHHKKDQENENTDFGKLENKKHTCVEGEQHTIKNELKESLQIITHNLRLLQMREWEKLPKL